MATLSLLAIGSSGSLGNELAQDAITFAMHGHILTNTSAWSPDSEWLVYDIREEGATFDSTRIERVRVEDGKVELIYESPIGRACGVVTHHPTESSVVFIDGMAPGNTEWPYSSTRRGGLIVNYGQSPPEISALDALDFTSPFTAGALRGGSHVHVFDSAGGWVSFTYEDEVLASSTSPGAAPNQRNVGVSVLGNRVEVDLDHSQNRSSGSFSFIATRTVAKPKAGSDEIVKAFEEGWIGDQGYLKPDGSRQRRALAFLGMVTVSDGSQHPEVYVCDLPEGPISEWEFYAQEDAALKYPAPPLGVSQRRITFTEEQAFPGVALSPRHWLRSSPDGSSIAFLMKDAAGVVCLWTVSPNGGAIEKVYAGELGDVQSAFTWSPDGKWIALIMDNSVFKIEVATGRADRLTPRSDDANAPCPEACVFSPDGTKIAYMRGGLMRNGKFTQIHVVPADPQ